MIVVSLAAAFAFAVSSSLKHVSASKVPSVQDLGARSLGGFVRATLAHPLWLGGIGADVVGLSLQVLALHLGALAVVQPLLISGLLFALVLRRRSGGVVRRRELGWAALVGVALATFLLVSGSAGAPVSAADHGPAAAAAVLGLLLTGVFVLLGRRQRKASRSAALLGIAVGTVYAATAALLKALTTIALGGPIPLLTSWQLYTVVALGATGLLLNQIAFQAGPLAASLPAIATVDPLLSIVIGVTVYDEPIRHGLLTGTGLTMLLLVIGGSVIQLTRSAEPR